MTALSLPPHQISGFRGHPDTLAKMRDVTLGARGERSLLVRFAAESIVRELAPKDYLGEILAIRFWVTEYTRYVNDPLHVELIKDPQRICEEIRMYGVSLIDCDEIAALIAALALCLGRNARFLVAGFGPEGQYSHVFAQVQEPRSGEWIIVDPVAGTDEVGMAERITTFYTVSLDE